MTHIDFKFQAKEYLARTYCRKSKIDLKFIIESANQITFKDEVENYLLVPVFVSERCVPNYIQALMKSLGNTKINILFFFNAHQDQMSEESFNSQLEERLGEINDLNSFGAPNIATCSRFFKRRTAIGKIRGIMADISIIFALGAQQEHPKIIFNDIDALGMSEDYFERIYNRLEDHQIKMVVGPVHWGYKDNKLYGFDENMKIPELYIYCEINKAILKCSREGLINYESRILFEGPSMAFPSSIYCAVGGFDWEKEVGEDDDLNFAIHRYNPNNFTFGVDGISKVHSPDEVLRTVYDPDAWLISDPRRILSTINEGKTGIESWVDDAFAKQQGAGFTPEQLASAYNSLEKRMNFEEIRIAGDSNDQHLRKKIMEQIFDTVLWMCFFEQRIRNQDQVKSILSHAGLIPNSLDCNLGTKTILERIDWQDCPFIHQLSTLH